MTPRADVAFQPAALTGPVDVALVVDVLRASTTLVALVERGCGAIHLASSVDTARRAARREPHALLIGEEGGLPPEGFDYGNSPADLAGAPVAGRTIIFATTNGSPALHAASEAARVVLVGCLRNASAAAREAWAAAGPEGAVLVVCAGRVGNTGGFGVDDLYAAGVLVQRLAAVGEVALTDAAEAALLVASAADDPLELFRRVSAGQHLIRIGLEADVVFAAQVDRSPVVPQLGRHLFLVRGEPSPT